MTTERLKTAFDALEAACLLAADATHLIEALDARFSREPEGSLKAHTQRLSDGGTAALYRLRCDLGVFRNRLAQVDRGTPLPPPSQMEILTAETEKRRILCNALQLVSEYAHDFRDPNVTLAALARRHTRLRKFLEDHL